MRRDAQQRQETEIKRLNGYHCGRFGKLYFYNSDRKVILNPNYTVSAENTASTLSIIKEGSTIGGYGIEWEMVNDSLRNCSNRSVIIANTLSMIFEKCFDADLFKIESDCTVDSESISQVMSKSAIRNNYKGFKACYDEYFPAFGFSTNDSRCGMHVNISLSLFGKDYETQVKNLRKLGFLINYNYDFFKVAFNRNGSTTWCPRMNSEMDYWKNTPIDRFPISHDRCCINMGHVREGRTEIRLVGGQKNYACFRNTMETVFFLIDNIKRLSWNDCTDLVKVFSGCNSYVFDRLKDNCLTANVISSADVEKIRPTVVSVRYL